MRPALRLLLLLALTASAARAANEFHYKIPDGWADVMSPNFVADNVPQTVMSEAAKGKYALYALDPARATRESVPVSFNVVEGSSTGKVTLGAVRQGAVEMSQQLGAMGATVNLEEMKVIQLDGIDIGFVSSSVETPRGSMRMLQYMIPGRTKVAVLTYVCPLQDFEHYKPIFESSAMATTGAYDHSGLAGGLAFKRIWGFGALGAIIAVIVTLIGTRKKPAAAVQAPTTTAPAAWDCPNCKRRVPIRVMQCRCGTPQPG